jgi:hypothetical protein
MRQILDELRDYIARDMSYDTKMNEFRVDLATKLLDALYEICINEEENR